MARRFTALILFITLLAPVQALSQEPSSLPASDRLAIKGVIESQMAAFQRDDGPGAFAYASPSIQQQFRNHENFMTMVRRGYRPVYRPQHVEFGQLRSVDDMPVQAVILVGPDGKPVMALYIMEQQEDGSWRINGVHLVEANEEII